MASLTARLLVVVTVLTVAFHYSLTTLVDGFDYQSPLADLALVPPIGCALMVAAAMRRRYVTSVRLTTLDLVVGAALAALALVVLFVLPVTMSKEYWAMRLDLLMLPVVAAAVLVVLFGLRGAVPFAFPILFLTLAWPLPYSVFLEHALDGFTSLTGRAAGALLDAGLPFATPLAGHDGLSYQVHGSGGHEFTLSVASACSGANSLIGFFVVAFAMLAVVRGRVLNRLAWLAAGLVLVWVANVLRIIGIFAAGHWFGEGFALDVLHPVAGLVALNVAVLISLALLRPLRLRLGLGDRHPLDSPLTREAPESERPTRRQLAPRFVAVGLLAVGLSVADGSLTSVAAGFENDGVPRMLAFTAHPVAGPNWTATAFARYDWARPFFGSSSEWMRYRLRPNTPAVAASNRFTVWVDSIRTPDLGALGAHPVRSCYDFHGYSVLSDRNVALGYGVTGEFLVYRNDSGAVWHAITWQWPIRRGGHVEHERMVLLSSTLSRPSAPPSPSPRSTVGRGVLAALNLNSPGDDPNPALGASLRGIAGQLVAARITAGDRS